MLVRALCLTIAALLADPASARPNTLSMSCADAAALVRAQGGIVLSTGEFTYDRYVASGAFCTPQEVTRRAWAPTADDPQCFIGFQCRSRIPRHNR
jgi:hypothetical protein